MDGAPYDPVGSLYELEGDAGAPYEVEEVDGEPYELERRELCEDTGAFGAP